MSGRGAALAIAAAVAVAAACNGRSRLDSDPAPVAGPRARPARKLAHGPGGAPHGMIGTDVSRMGLPAPDPKRHIDPSHWVQGVIRVDPRVRARATAGTPVFVVARRVDAGGRPSGPPLAVRRMTWQGDGMPFNLTEAQAMLAGTQLVGDVLVTAHYDQDGDALTRQPGDLVGQVRVTIPARGVQLMLDAVLP